VVRLLSHIHKIDSEKHAVAFKGRLQHFQRLKFPEGVNTGKGRPAHYGAGQLIALAVALEMTQLGLPPERAVLTLRSNTAALTSAIRAAVYWASVPNFAQGSIILTFDPAALSGLRVGGDKRDLASETFDYSSWGHFKIRVDQWEKDSPFKRLALINLSALIFDDIGLWLEAMEVNVSEPFASALKKWTDIEMSGELPIYANGEMIGHGYDSNP
jgi:hypothetical protein